MAGIIPVLAFPERGVVIHMNNRCGHYTPCGCDNPCDSGRACAPDTPENRAAALLRGDKIQEYGR